MPCLGGRPLVQVPQGAHEVIANVSGYVQFIYAGQLQKAAEAADVNVYVTVSVAMRANLLAANGMNVGTTTDVDIVDRCHVDVAAWIVVMAVVVYRGHDCRTAIAIGNKLIGINHPVEIDHTFDDLRGQIGRHIDMSGARLQRTGTGNAERAGNAAITAIEILR